MKKQHPIILIAVALALAVCRSGAEPATVANSVPSVATASASNYKITPGDVVEVRVFREDDLLTTTRVTDDGTIGFPLIGTVHIAGKTDAEAARTVRDLLDARFLVNPSVTVNITAHGKRTFTVLGQVQKPGVYNMTYHDKIGLLEACGMAGGYTRFANSAGIVVKRAVNGKDTVFTLNATRMAGKDNAETFQVLPGDAITVPESRF
jgi:protein involved in polysaccharide export with SLBB domain